MSYETKFAEYCKNGFAILRGAFDVVAVEQVLRETREVFQPVLGQYGIDAPDAGGTAFDDALEELFRRNMPAYLSAAKATQSALALHALGVCGQMIELVRSFGIAQPLIAVRPVVHIVSDALQVPGGYHRTPAHQDWRSVQGSLDALVVWLPLVPIDCQFGTLEVVPGSHLDGLYKTRSDPFGNVLDDAAFDEARFVPVEVGPGDAVVFSMFTVHRTGAEQRRGVRWAASFRYNNAASPDYAAHGYPSPFVYKSQDELLFDRFPTSEDVRAIFGKGT